MDRYMYASDSHTQLYNQLYKKDNILSNEFISHLANAHHLVFQDKIRYGTLVYLDDIFGDDNQHIFDIPQKKKYDLDSLRVLKIYLDDILDSGVFILTDLIAYYANADIDITKKKYHKDYVFLERMNACELRELSDEAVDLLIQTAYKFYYEEIIFPYVNNEIDVI